MNCPHCGAALPSRPLARMMTTGLFFCVAGFVLLLFVHFPVAVLAAVLMTLVGASSIKAALKAHKRPCPSCRRLPARY